MQHDRYEMDILKQLTRIANVLEKLEQKVPDASRIIFGENLLGKDITGGLYIGYSPREGESIKEQIAKAMEKWEEEE